MKHSFDEIFVVHLANDKERYEHLTNEFNKIGIKPTIWWTTKRPFSTKIADCFYDTLKDGWYDHFKQYNENIYGSVFNCTLAHYDIIKTSYERGLNRILICEDDITFCNDLKTIEYYFNNFPKEDYGIIKYHTTQFPYSDNLDSKPTYVVGCTSNFSTMCYSLSRLGMKYYIDFIDSKFVAADIPFAPERDNVKEFLKDYNINIINHMYNTSKHICWPKDEQWDISKSHILSNN